MISQKMQLIVLIFLSVVFGYLLANLTANPNQPVDSKDAAATAREEILTVVKSTRGLARGTVLEATSMRSFEIPKSYASPLSIRWADRRSYEGLRLLVDILPDDYILQNGFDYQRAVTPTSIKPGPGEDIASAANNYCRDRMLSPVEVKKVIAGDHANKVTLACALWQTNFDTAKDILPEDLDRALTDTDETVRVLAMKFAGGTDAKRRSIIMNSLSDSNPDVVAEAIAFNCQHPQELSEAHAQKILNWLTKTAGKGLGHRECANLLLATYADGEPAEVGLKNYQKDLSTLLQNVKAAGDGLTKDAYLLADLMNAGVWTNRLSKRAKRLEPLAPTYIEFLQSKIPAAFRSNIIGALGNVAGDAAKAKEILCQQFALGDNSVNFATERALQKLGLNKQDCEQ